MARSPAGPGVYSFLDVNAAISGPNGSFSFSNTAGVADEGITISMEGDKSTLTTGADGFPMFSLHAAKNGSVMIRLQKTSPYNSLLSKMYNADTASSANFGQNTITISNAVRGDTTVCQSCGFRKHPDNLYAKEAGNVEWTFSCGTIDIILGTGAPVTGV